MGGLSIDPVLSTLTSTLFRFLQALTLLIVEEGNLGADSWKLDVVEIRYRKMIELIAQSATELHSRLHLNITQVTSSLLATLPGWRCSSLDSAHCSYSKSQL